jgi:hypothetical protein
VSNHRESWNAGGAVAIVAAGLVSLAGPASQGQAVETRPGAVQAVPFDAAHWVLDSDGEFVRFGGRAAFRGTGYVKDVKLRNAVVETDIWAAEAVSFAGLSFHLKSFEDQQLIWFRIHKTNGLAADAVQYAPAYHGVFCWQLNPKANAAAKLPKNEWVHLKLVIVDGTATLYVEDMAKPIIRVDRLRPGAAEGSIGLWTYSKGEIYFSDFSYQAVDSGGTAGPKPAVPPNVVADWRLSPSYPLSAVDAVPTAYPARQLSEVESWIVPEVDSDGLVDISRYHGTKFHGRRTPAGGRPDWTMLRTFLEASGPARVKMSFGYSDAVTIFLNGAPLFSGNSAFLARNGLDSEWIGWSDAVFLDLKKGRNELMAAVAEDFGGWGFQARLEDAEGVEVRAASEERAARSLSPAASMARAQAGIRRAAASPEG